MTRALLCVCLLAVSARAQLRLALPSLRPAPLAQSAALAAAPLHAAPLAAGVLSPSLSLALSPALEPAGFASISRSALGSGVSGSKLDLEQAVAAAVRSETALETFWRGSRSERAEVLPLALSHSGLDTHNGAVAAAILPAVELAQSVPTGRRTFARFSALGKPVRVAVKELGHHLAEFDYLTRTLYLRPDMLTPGSRHELAATLVHELTHVLQHEQGVPANALEMEIEAHLADLRLLEELGRRPKHPFPKKLQRALDRGRADEFVRILRAQLPDRYFLPEQGVEEIMDIIDEQLSETRDQAYLRRLTSDLAYLSTAAGQGSYRRFSRRVLDQLRRRAAQGRRAAPSR